MANQSTEKRITVEVAYALPDEQFLKEMTVPEGATIADVIEQSGLLELYPDIDLEKNGVGIFSKASKLDTVVREHDRVEVYRPLIADPKEARRKKAAAQKKASQKRVPAKS